MNIGKLKGKIAERNLNIEKLAAAIGTERSSLYRKMSKSEKITVGEALKIKNALALTDEEACEIFLT